MSKKKRLPIGNDDFRKIREGDFYYIDKTLMIRDFIEMQDEVALIARPRRFGKTLNMTMLWEFFDITKDSRDIFEGLEIMNTEYAAQINSRPVIYLSLKSCKGIDRGAMLHALRGTIYREYLRQEEAIRDKLKDGYEKEDFYKMIEILRGSKAESQEFESSLFLLTQIVNIAYGLAPILLIDEYDQPIMSSYERGYHSQMGDFFPNFYGDAMKGNATLGQALLTGVQRVAKESIFSQFNNARVYTVLHQQYAPYFGLTASETGRLLDDYGLSLEDSVQKKYNGYCFGGIQMYNPWSILNYADIGRLRNYWANTSSNVLIKQLLQKANKGFWDKFDQLVTGDAIPVWLTLETSYIERDSDYSLWGLLVNSGYLTVVEEVDEHTAVVKIPNDEVMSEFQMIIAEISGVEGLDLKQMFSCLRKKEMNQFFSLYQKIVINCTSYMDAAENAYHMLFLGMCITLRGAYKVTSNLEAGYGRSDITLEALKPGGSHVIVEFKQGKELDHLKDEALAQILEQKYYIGLQGEVICIGLAHDKKRCQMVHRVLQIGE